MTTVNYDEIIVLTGGFGKYQRRIYFLYLLTAISPAMHSMSGVFLGALPKFRCLLPFENDENSTYYTLYNESRLENNMMNINNYYYPLDNKTGELSQCQRYDIYNLSHVLNNSIVKCNSYIYDKRIYQLTTTTEFNIVCDNEWLKATSDALFMVGVMLGALIFGALADVYGRKSIYCLCVFLNIIAGILLAFTPENISYICIRLMLGMSVNSMYLTSYVSAVEMVLPDKRMAIGVGMQCFFTCGYILVVVFAYFIRNWRILQFAITVPSIAFLTYWWLVPESVRWLLVKNRNEEAKYLIEKASLKNGIKLSKDQLDVIIFKKNNHADFNSESRIKKKEEETSSWLDLFKYPNLRRKSLLLFFNWFIINSTYYGISWNTSNLGGNDFVNFSISGLVEIPAHIFTYFTLDKWGRKIILSGCTVFAGLSLILVVFIPTDTNWVIIVLTMLGKMAITASFEISYVFSAEQYPTVIRNVAVGFCSTFARMGGIVAPYIIYSSNIWKSLPYVLLGLGCLISGLLVLLLPETLNQKLPESIKDGEEFGKKKSSSQREGIYKK